MTDEADLLDGHERLQASRTRDLVLKCLLSLPQRFRSTTHIDGINATDIFALGAAFSKTIEDQTVDCLNSMRPIWDPDNDLSDASFHRQSQTFPDVLLRRACQRPTSSDVILGIELKSWYVFAKEQVPTFRFSITKNACAELDMLVVVPWCLSDIISGTPIVLRPYSVGAREAATRRNICWSSRGTSADTSIKSPDGAAPYPRKKDKIEDVPACDSGNNFGRYARTGAMDEYIAGIMNEPVRGINVRNWLNLFTGAGSSEQLSPAIQQPLLDVGAG